MKVVRGLNFRYVWTSSVDQTRNPKVGAYICVRAGGGRVVLGRELSWSRSYKVL